MQWRVVRANKAFCYGLNKLWEVHFPSNTITRVLPITCSFHVVQYLLSCAASIVVHEVKVLQSCFSRLVLSGWMTFAWGQQNCRFQCTVGERTTNCCNCQSDLYSAMPRQTRWSHSEVYTYKSCDWIGNREPLRLNWACKPVETTINLAWLKGRTWRFSYWINCNWKCKYCGALQALPQHVQLFETKQTIELLSDQRPFMRIGDNVQFIRQVWTRVQAHIM